MYTLSLIRYLKNNAIQPCRTIMYLQGVWWEGHTEVGVVELTKEDEQGRGWMMGSQFDQLAPSKSDCTYFCRQTGQEVLSWLDQNCDGRWQQYNPHSQTDTLDHGFGSVGMGKKIDLRMAIEFWISGRELEIWIWSCEWGFAYLFIVADHIGSQKLNFPGRNLEDLWEEKKSEWWDQLPY